MNVTGGALSRDKDETIRQLREMNSDLADAMRIVAHDLKAPLRAVANLSTWIEEDIQEQLGERLPDDTRRQMNLLRTRLDEMDSRIDGLSRYLGAGRTNDRAEPIDVSALIAEAVAQVNPPADFQVVVASAVATVLGTRSLLREVFVQLIDNAVRHHHAQQGRVRISASETADAHCFSVEDDGPGIPQEHHAHVFGAFFKLPRSPASRLGLGLALVRRAVSAHGGQVRIAHGEARGTCVELTWPKIPSAPA